MYFCAMSPDDGHAGDVLCLHKVMDYPTGQVSISREYPTTCPGASAFPASTSFRLPRGPVDSRLACDGGNGGAGGGEEQAGGQMRARRSIAGGGPDWGHGGSQLAAERPASSSLCCAAGSLFLRIRKGDVVTVREGRSFASPCS
jgi:hypothetical protein